MPVQERSASLRVPSRDGLTATLDRRSTQNSLLYRRKGEKDAFASLSIKEDPQFG